MRLIAVLLAAITLTGCSTQGGKFLGWFGVGGREAKKVEKQEAVVEKQETKVDEAAEKARVERESLLKKVQESALVTDLAVAAAPESRPVAVARVASGDVVAGLDQALEPLTVIARNKLKLMVEGLLSENLEIRAKAETDAQAARGQLEAVSARLTTAQSLVAAQLAALETAQDRLAQLNQDAQKKAAENLVLANERRAALFQMWLARWLAIGAVVIGGITTLYLKLQLGGIGKGLAAAKAAGFDLSKITPHLDAVTSWLGQRIVRSARVKEEVQTSP